MARDGKTHIIRAKTFTEAVSKAKSKFGSDFNIVTRRDIREEAGLFRKLTGGKLEAPEVELEIMPASDRKPSDPKPGPVAPNPLLRTYEKAREGAEKHSAAARQAMTASALPYLDVGTAANGIAACLDEVRQALRKAAEDNATLRKDVVDLMSLQARGGLPAVGGEFLGFFRRLVDADIGADLAREIIEAIQRARPDLVGEEAILAAVRAEVARRIPAAGPILAREAGPTVVSLVGPSGMGKSTALAKLAIAHAYANGGRTKVGLVNEDLHRPGADRQLVNLAGLIGVPMVSANDPTGIADAVRSMSGRDLVLVDTAGRSPTDAAGIERLGELLRAAGTSEAHLVLSGSCSLRMMRSSAERFRAIGFNRTIITKLDECERLGEILNFAADLAEGLSYVTDGSDYSRPVLAADSGRLADLILGLTRIEEGGA